MVPSSTTLYGDCMVLKPYRSLSLLALLTKHGHTTPVQIPLQDSNHLTRIVAFSIRPKRLFSIHSQGRGLFPSDWASLGTEHTAVSYTHLDVYKRQEQAMK